MNACPYKLAQRTVHSVAGRPFLRILHMLVSITAHTVPKEHNMSTENINQILDKLILQTQRTNETGPVADLKDLIPDVETKPGNDSDIYYFKTYMAPHINFKSSSEIHHGSRHSNKTAQSHEVSNEDQNLTSADGSLPGTSENTRKSFTELEKQRHIMPKLLRGEQESRYSEFKRRTGDMDENDYSLEDLIKKEIAAELSTASDDKMVSFTQHEHQKQQLSMLHQYPEIIIDHITYDNDDNNKNKIDEIKSTHDAKHMENEKKENEINEDTNGKVQTQQPQKIRHDTLEDDIEIADRDPPEQFGPRNHLIPEIKVLVDSVIQKKAMHDALLKQTTEREARKQSILLEKILQRLPAKKTFTNNIKSYLVRHERIQPPEIETLSRLQSSLEALHSNGGHRLTKSYLSMPLLPTKWDIHNRLLRKLVQMCRPEVLKRRRRVGLIDRIVPNIDYRPVYYDLYKK